jgi:mono/diheme cytochrome c family protein
MVPCKPATTDSFQEIHRSCVRVWVSGPALVVFLATTVIAAGLAAQDAGRATSAVGVYTEEQSARGRLAYQQSCGPCHGDNLDGAQGAPALAGDSFLDHWTDQTVGDLFENIRTGMPMDNPGSLTDKAFVDIVGFILQRNNYPAGDQELPAEKEALDKLPLVRK